MKIFKILNNNKGSTYVITALVMTIIMGMAALVIDVGNLYIEREELNNAVDAATLAGAQELPADPIKAFLVAAEYCQNNGVSMDNVNIYITDNNQAIEVTIKDNVDFTFARVLGIDNSEVSANSKAIIGPVTAVYSGIRPLAVERQSFIYGQQHTLKLGALDGTNGNFGPVSLGGLGSKSYEENVKYGYNEKLKVGDWVDTETGNMVGATTKAVNFILDNNYDTFNNYPRDSMRLWIVPMVDSMEILGRKSVQIVGFALFFLEGINKSGGHTEVTGRFIEFTTNGDVSEGQVDYGLKGIKLVK